jgi:hypothetical protein
MNPHYKSFSRRSFLSVGASALVLPLLGFWPRLVKGKTARIKLSHGDKSLGLKISENRKGQVIVTMRQLGGKRLLACNLGRPNAASSREEYSGAFKLKDGKTVQLKLSRKAGFSSNLKGVKFEGLNYRSDNDDSGSNRPGNNRPSGEGFFNWLSNLVNDVLVVIGAGLAWLTGGSVFLHFSSGSTIFVNYDGGVEYEPSNFKLEPGMEENPLIWY